LVKQERGLFSTSTRVITSSAFSLS